MERLSKINSREGEVGFEGLQVLKTDKRSHNKEVTNFLRSRIVHELLLHNSLVFLFVMSINESKSTLRETPIV